VTQLKPFEASSYLTDGETIAEFLTACLEDDNPDVFLSALQEVAKARGMTQLAKDTGLNRESLDKALTPGGKPRYDTILWVLSALKIRLVATH